MLCVIADASVGTQEIYKPVNKNIFFFIGSVCLPITGADLATGSSWVMRTPFSAFVAKPIAASLALRAWVAETAFKEPRTAFFEWEYAAAYVPERGFGVAVDGIVQLPRAAAKKALFKVVFSLVTPERHLFYAEPPMTGGAEFTIAHELGSHRESPRFADAMKIFREEDYHASLAVVFEVRGVERAKGDQLDVPPAARG